VLPLHREVSLTGGLGQGGEDAPNRGVDFQRKDPRFNRGGPSKDAKAIVAAVDSTASEPHGVESAGHKRNFSRELQYSKKGPFKQMHPIKKPELQEGNSIL